MEGGCTHILISGCKVCRADGDCDDSNPCTADACGADGCESTTLPGCRSCIADAECDDADACTVDVCDETGQCLYAPTDCFAALSCPFVARLGVGSCFGEAIPRSITRLVDKAGCKIEQAEARARKRRGGVERRLSLADRRLARAAKKVTNAGRSGKGGPEKLSPGCIDGLAVDLGDRIARIEAIMDRANDGNRLASCTAAMTAPDAAPQQSGPSLCSKR
jgi:hypothetical protein